MKFIKIGITGGMGCGKSTLLRYLDSFDFVRTIDLDKIAFKNYDLNKWSLKNIETSFGPSAVLRDPSSPNHLTGINRVHLS